MRKINCIIVHCSATKEGKNFTAADIDRWHKEIGYSCIGYHYVVRLDGTIEVGRDITKIGAHCKGHNTGSVGVCYIGGLDSRGKAKDTRTEAQKEALKKLLQDLCEKYGLSSLQVYGHNDFANKDCPCFDVAREYVSGMW